MRNANSNRRNNVFLQEGGSADCRCSASHRCCPSRLISAQGGRMREKVKWLIVFALLGLTLGMLSCGKQVVVGVYPVAFSPEDNAIAHTVCDLRGSPLILFNRELFESPKIPAVAWHYILIHESVHVEDMLNGGGCRKTTMKYQTDPEFRLRAEAKATCAEFWAEVSDGVLRDQEGQLKSLKDGLRSRYGQGLTAQQFEDFVACFKQPP